MHWLLVSLFLSVAPPHTSTTGRATVYWPGDGFNAGLRADGVVFTKTDAHIAHRSAPIGSLALVCSHRTKLCVLTSVQDRGPFGAVRLCSETAIGRPIHWEKKCHRWKALTRPLEGWSYRGVADLTLPVAKALGGHRGFDEVTIYLWRPNLTAKERVS